MENEAGSPAVRRPGAQLEDILSLVDMARQELALRTGVSEKRTFDTPKLHKPHSGYIF